LKELQAMEPQIKGDKQGVCSFRDDLFQVCLFPEITRFRT